MAKNTHIVLKPFMAQEKNGEVVQPMDGFTPLDSARAADLERQGMIVRSDKTAPQNKDAQALRRTK